MENENEELETENEELEIENEPLDPLGTCPICEKSWDDGDIWRVWRKMECYNHQTDAGLIKMAKIYYPKPCKFTKLIGLEHIKGYEGLAWWKCPFCLTIWDRDTNEIIKGGKIQRRNG